MAFAVSGAVLGGAVRAPRLTGGGEGSLVFRHTGLFLTRNDPATPPPSLIKCGPDSGLYVSVVVVNW